MRLPLRLKTSSFAVSAVLLLSGCDIAKEATAAANKESAPATVSKAEVVKHYAEVAHATFQDALTTAQTLDAATDALIANPSAKTLEHAKYAWLAARVPYQQSEVFRFGNAIVDDWEGQLNAWPLDEGLIDYVESADYQHELGNAGATANIVGSEEVNVGGTATDVSKVTPELLAALNEVGGSEANVATGYHAIEFLLWGQDLNGFEAGNGDRPATDYASGEECTNGNCDRRGAYLDAVTDLLVSDLQWMVNQWSPEGADNYRTELLAMAPDAALQKMLFGMGSLSLGELAGERMKVALEANSYEDEHDCFSDNTHNSHFYNAQGIKNVYTGEYQRTDGKLVTGPSLSALVAQANPELDKTLRSQLNNSMDALQTMKQKAEASQESMTFDMMIAPGNEAGAKIINSSIAALVQQTGSIEKVAGVLNLGDLQPDDAGHAF